MCPPLNQSEKSFSARLQCSPARRARKSQENCSSPLRINCFGPLRNHWAKFWLRSHFQGSSWSGESTCFPEKAPTEPRDAVRGRLPVVPPPHWRSADALVLESGEARRRSLAHASQRLNETNLTTADRGRQINRIHIFIHKSGRINLTKRSERNYFSSFASAPVRKSHQLYCSGARGGFKHFALMQSHM